MKATLVVTDSAGNVFEGEIELVTTNTSPKHRAKPTPREPADDEARHDTTVDFSLPLRAFMNRYARGRSGPEAFTMLVARLANGEIDREVRADEIRREWTRMTGILGNSFAAVFGTRAKNQAWVDSPQRGVFVLLPDWTGALQEVNS